MVDLHTHILPQMDDGSRNAEQTAKMLRMMVQQGTDLVVATPHFYAHKESPQEFLHRRSKAYENMAGIPEKPEIRLGAEVAYFSAMGNCRSLEDLCIAGSRLILIEMPFVAWSDSVIGELLAVHRNLGLQPVLAHVDRYRRMPNFWQILNQLLEVGVLAQCNADAICTPLLGRYLLRMIHDGKICFLGSDCHNLTTRAPNLNKAIERMQKIFSPEFVQEFDRNARDYLTAADGKEL